MPLLDSKPVQFHLNYRDAGIRQENDQGRLSSEHPSLRPPLLSRPTDPARNVLNYYLEERPQFQTQQTTHLPDI